MKPLACVVGFVCLSLTPTLAGPTDDVQELIAQGKQALGQQKYDEAIKQLQQAKTDPRRKAEAGYLLGECFGVKKKIYALAIKELETAREELVEMDCNPMVRSLSHQMTESSSARMATPRSRIRPKAAKIRPTASHPRRVP